MAVRRGAGTKFAVGSTADPATAVFTALPQVTSIRVRRAAGRIETTDLDAAAKQYIQDLRDGDVISLSLNYDPALASQDEAVGLVALLNSGAERAFRLTPFGATKHEKIVGFLSSGDFNFEPSAAQKFDIEIQCSGASTYVAV